MSSHDLFNELKEQVRERYNFKEVELVTKAYTFALKAHGGQNRISGEPFIIHPVAVAQILVSLELDIPTIGAALLHDVVEDTSVVLAEIEEEFGAEIALLVDGVTKLSKLQFRSKEEQQVENLRKMFLAMAKDIRVIMIKLADRLHNMRTLNHQSQPKQKEIAEETLEIFAPLAHRLGIFTIKWELEDLAFRYLKPQEYNCLVEKIAMKRQEREAYIEHVIDILKDKLEEAGLQADIQGRPKHFYSIYQKMIEKEKDLNEIYDLIAVRVIVHTVRDCYAVLGIIHTLWTPIPRRFKDYIAMPKPNMYQSLHTTVMGFLGEPFEIQIRTQEMHRTAEFGIAAHWKYKEGYKKGSKELEKRLAWLRKILEWQKEVKDTKEFMELLKIDIFSDVVFVFTPKGDVKELPAGSIPLDFAYRIHSDVGHSCVGCRVNGKMVPLDYVLKNGDIVEIITSKQSSSPSRDWLKMVKTSQAKSRIRQWFKKEKREEHLLQGRDNLEKELKKQGFEPASKLKNEWLQEIAPKFGMNHYEDLLVAIGEGALGSYQVFTRLRGEFFPSEKQLPSVALTELQKGIKKEERYHKVSHGIKVKGEEGVLVRLAHCCHPLPGDLISGYITRGRGVSVHRADCNNIRNLKKEEEGRIIEVVWDEAAESIYQVELEIYALDSTHLPLEIMSALAEMKIHINTINARTVRHGHTVINLKVDIRSIKQLNLLIEKIKKIRDVLDVFRVTPKK
ncbi:MAG: bifunctional (p)ppGpp synthetase/guanosine-3',5'-bis(diphosphate) 3'-pyrophosphohydrolase [Clostridia bacterium]|nr:bifunctional (p)ppGpp synthetase/guanosine-3',5'-bis(diphosphate) 3'-pyrophosphohydrolase [Clostridia bacterium]